MSISLSIKFFIFIYVIRTMTFLQASHYIIRNL